MRRCSFFDRLIDFLEARRVSDAICCAEFTRLREGICLKVPNRAPRVRARSAGGGHAGAIKLGGLFRGDLAAVFDLHPSHEDCLASDCFLMGMCLAIVV